MKILLDTHVFLWWISGDARLSANAQAVIEDSRNELFLSAASGWEIAIKFGIGKLPLPDVPERFVTEQLRVNGIVALPVTLLHALHVHTLPALHNDPFDRLLIIQSELEGMTLLTDDAQIRRYSITALW